MSEGGETAAIRTGETELTLFSTSTWAAKKCRVRARGFFTFIDANLISVIGVDNRVYMVDPRTGASRSSFAVPRAPLGPPAICGRSLCLATRSGDLSTVFVTDLAGHVQRQFSTIAMFASPADQLLCASPDGHWLVALGWDQAIVYEAGTWRKVADIKGGFSKGYFGGFLTLCAFRADGKVIALGNAEFQQTVETGTWKRKDVFPHPGHRAIALIAKPADPGFVALFGDGSLREYPDTLKVHWRDSNGPSGTCIAVALGKGGLLLTGWANGEVRRQTITHH